MAQKLIESIRCGSCCCRCYCGVGGRVTHTHTHAHTLFKLAVVHLRNPQDPPTGRLHVF